MKGRPFIPLPTKPQVNELMDALFASKLALQNLADRSGLIAEHITEPLVKQMFASICHDADRALAFFNDGTPR